MKGEQVGAQQLKERRLEMGLTIEEAAEAIHVPVYHVEAIERGDFGRLPPRCYALGFLRSYCRFLGMEPGPFLAWYCVSQGGSREESPNGTVRRGNLPTGPRLAELLAWVTVCGLLVFGWFAYTVVVRPQADLTEGQVEAGSVEMVVPPPPDYEVLNF